MTTESWIRLWREAYIDLHTAYLALMRMRHQRKNSPADLIEKDMKQLNPFYMDGALGGEAVEKWMKIWEENQHDNEAARIMACVTATMQNHWQSWAAFMERCPPDLKKFKISVPFDSYLLTATTVSRSTLEKRAEALAQARERHLKGDG
ncbi:MAG: hypothetical protein ACYTHM_17625 [Planctomycetota bacterium]|jgi:hypothetical protein